MQLRARRISQFVGTQTHAEAEFGVVFKQRIIPGRPPALGVGGVGRGRQIATIN
jgi:hypothetical protein